MATYRELSERSFDAWNREDLAGWLETLDPAGEYHTSGVFPGLRSVYRGHDQLAAFWHAMHEPWESLRVDLERYAEGDDWTVVKFRFRAKGVESGAAVDMSFCNASRIRNGRATHIYARRDFDEAVRALESEATKD